MASKPAFYCYFFNHSLCKGLPLEKKKTNKEDGVKPCTTFFFNKWNVDDAAYTDRLR